MSSDWLLALVGGLFIGFAASLMLVFMGRIAGISGIVHHLLGAKDKNTDWRLSFVAGLVTGGIMLGFILPNSLTQTASSPVWQVILAGLLVGFGTVMGSGCTSGHGICGVSRLSVRSIVATGTFMATGILAVYLLKHIG